MSVLALPANSPAFGYTNFTISGLVATGSASTLLFQYHHDNDFWRLNNMLGERCRRWLHYVAGAAHIRRYRFGLFAQRTQGSGSRLTIKVYLKRPADSAGLFLVQKEKRVKGIEPSCPAWEAGVLPLNYTRAGFRISDCGLRRADLQERVSLPGNYVVGTCEIRTRRSSCAESCVAAKRPGDYPLTKGISACATGCSVGISNLVVIIGINPNCVCCPPWIVELPIRGVPIPARGLD